MEYQFKIQIKGISKPPVWRKVVVPANFTFLKFHEVIQTVFGWCDYHLFAFKDSEYQSAICIALPDDDGFDSGAKTEDASKVKLSKVFSGGICKLLYVYDFGDNWVHEITLEAVTDEKRKTAICLAGKGNCPPEDCGGVFGYQEMKHVLQTKPDSEEAAEFRNWMGLDEEVDWNASTFDLDEINACLEEV